MMRIIWTYLSQQFFWIQTINCRGTFGSKANTFNWNFKLTKEKVLDAYPQQSIFKGYFCLLFCCWLFSAKLQVTLLSNKINFLIFASHLEVENLKLEGDAHYLLTLFKQLRCVIYEFKKINSFLCKLILSV